MHISDHNSHISHALDDENFGRHFVGIALYIADAHVEGAGSQQHLLWERVFLCQ